MNIENTTDFSSYLRNITDDECAEETPFFMDKKEYTWMKTEFINRYGFITDRDCKFLIWRCNLDGLDFVDFFRENFATIEIDNDRYTPKQLAELHLKYPWK